MSYHYIRIFIIALITGSIIMLGGCQAKETWKTYMNDAYSYSIEYPSAWSLNEQFSSQLAVIKSPDEKVMVSVLVSDSAGRNLDQQVTFYSSAVKAGSFYYQVVSDKSVKFQGLDARQLMVAYQNDKDSPRYVSIELYVVEKGRAYLLRCTALESELKTLPSDYQKVLSTFKLTK